MRSTIAWIRSSETSLRSGTPPTVVAETTETIWSPWPPSTTALTSFTERAGLPGDERLEAGGVEDARLAEDALLREAGDVLRDVAHRVERVRDDDQDRVGRFARSTCSVTDLTIFSFV